MAAPFPLAASTQGAFVLLLMYEGSAANPPREADGEVERVSRGKKTKGRAFLLLFARRLKAEERAGARADTTTGREERSERAPQGVPNLNSFISRTRPTLVPKRVVWKMEG